MVRQNALWPVAGGPPASFSEERLHSYTSSREEIPKDKEFLEALSKTRHVVVSTDEVSKDETEFTRTGYVGVFEIADFQRHGDVGFSFRYVKRVANAR